MKHNKLNILITLLFSAVFLSVNAQCIYPENGNFCISAESSEYVFRIDLQENIDSVYWQVKGGIDIVSSTQTSVTVKSKNTEDQKYSKGRIDCYAYIKHNIGNECSFSYPILLSSKDVYKSFNINNLSRKIWGLSAVSVGDTCLYSIKPIFTDINNIGMDNYYWTFSNGFSNDVLYTSADGSAIAIKATGLSGNDTIRVAAGQCNTGNLALAINKANTPNPPNQNTCSAEVIPYTVPVYGSNVFYTLDKLANVVIKIYDKNDNYIRTIFSAYMGQGRQAVYFQPTNLISGEKYKCVIEIDSENPVGRISKYGAGVLPLRSLCSLSYTLC